MGKDEILPMEWVDEVKRLRVTNLLENSTWEAAEIELNCDNERAEIADNEFEEGGRAGGFGVKLAADALAMVAIASKRKDGGE